MNEEIQPIVTSTQNPLSKKKGMPTWGIVVMSILGGGLLVAVLGYVFLVYYNISRYQPVQVGTVQGDTTVLNDQASTTPDMIDGEVFEKGEDAFGQFVRMTEEAPKDYSNMFASDPIRVDWFSHAMEVPDAIKERLLTEINSNYSLDTLAFATTVTQENITGDDAKVYSLFLYKLGTVHAPNQLQGESVYLFSYPVAGMGVGVESQYVVYVETLHKFIVLQEDTQQFYGIPNFVVDISTYLGGIVTYRSDISYPEEIAIPGTDEMLFHTGAYAENRNAFSYYGAPNNAGGIANIVTGNILMGYPTSAREFTMDDGTDVYFVDGAYRIILKDGSVQEYELLPSFLKKPDDAQEKQMYGLGYTTDVTWNKDFSQSNNMYLLGGDIITGGCNAGIEPGTNVVSNKPWFDEVNLEKVGTAKNGDGVFTMKNPEENQMYKELFVFGGQAAYMVAHPDVPFGEEQKVPEKMRLAEFFANDPVVFWKDHKDRWRVYFKSEYQSLAECGKPVIYLYPEKAMDVNVQVAPNGGFTYTDPVYPESGWFVNATPEGKLYSYSDKASYPYLFWEGHADGFGFSDKGFVFSRDTLEQEMTDLLAKTGLNKQETKDFLEFWLPKMQEKPYVFVTFANQSAFEFSAPLTITPRPDSVLRVFMNFKSLDTYKKVEPLLLRGFERKGFTVVEWGGVLEKK